MVTQLEQIEQTLRKVPDQHLEFLAKQELIERILTLKSEKNVLILGHNYMEPLVFQLSGESERGDSLGLSRAAAKADNPIILFDGVRFMAETAKILAPQKKVLIADLEAGCSLADPFRREQVLEYRKQYPHAPVVTYINSYADVKAESDYCCTSANALNVVLHAAETFDSHQVIFLPDALMGANIQQEVEHLGIELIWPGRYDEQFVRCEVHEQFQVEHIHQVREQYNIPKGAPDAAVLVHWECLPEVVAEADYCGSTTQMGRYIAEHPEIKRVFLATECEMAANLSSEFPEVEFVKSCNIFCQHMRKITLEKIHHSLVHEVYEVHVDPDIAARARTAIDRMLEAPSGQMTAPRQGGGA